MNVPTPQTKGESGMSRQVAARGIARVLDAFGHSRLLAFDRDAATRGPTVVVSHEALLREWPLLRGWLRDSRGEVRQQRQLALAAAEWGAANRDPSFLLSGARLAQFEAWQANASVALTPDEAAYLTASALERDRRIGEESRRQARELALERRSRRGAAGPGRRLARRGRDRGRVGLVGQHPARNGPGCRGAGRLQSAALRCAASGGRVEGAHPRRPRRDERAALLALRSISFTYTPQGDEALSWALYLDYPLRVFAGHEDLVWDGGFLADDSLIYTVGTDQVGSVRLWDVTTGNVVRSFDILNGCMEANVSPDGATLAAACLDVPSTSECRHRRRARQIAHRRLRKSKVRFSPDGTQILTAGLGSVATLWDLATAAQIRTFVPTDTELADTMAVDFAPDGDRVVTGGMDGVVRLWDLASGELIREYCDHTDWAWGVEVSPDGRYLVSTSIDSGGARLWDLETGQLLHRLMHVNTTSYEIDFSSDSRYVLTGGLDTAVKMWDVETGKELRRFTHAQIPWGVEFSKDGRFVLTTSWDRAARLWSLQGDDGLLRFESVEAPANGALSHDGSRLALTSVDNSIRLIDTATGQELGRLTGHLGPLWDLAFSPTDDVLATISSADGSTRLWDLNIGRAVWADPTFGGQSLAFSPDGRTLYAIGSTVQIYDVATGQMLRDIEYSENFIYGALSPDGSLLATSLGTREDILLWNLATDSVVRILHPDVGGVHRALIFSPDGRLLATGGDAGIIYLWNVATGTVVRRFVGHTTMIERAIDFSSDGRYLASGSFDRTVRIWDVATGDELRRFTGYADGLPRVAFTPDDSRLMTISNDGIVRLTYVRLQDAIDDLCRRLITDLDPDARARYGINDQGPTCAP